MPAEICRPRINNAQPGDTIVLQAGATFTGNFTLPVKSGTAYITIRSSAADASLPAANVRINPSYASLSPEAQERQHLSPVLTTAAGAHHWRLQFLEFQANSGGSAEMLRLGSSSEVNAGQPGAAHRPRSRLHPRRRRRPAPSAASR